MPTSVNVMRQPTARPTMRPSGMPKVIAIELPVATRPMATGPCSSPTTRTANGEATDQKMACAQATSRRANTSATKLGATAEQNCPAANTAMMASMSCLGLKRLAKIMSGSDSTMTAQA